MIDLKLLREDTERIKKLILQKEPSFSIDELIKFDTDVRLLRVVIEDLRKKRNELATQGAQGITDDLRKQSIGIGKELKQKEKELVDQEKEYKSLWLSCPNIPQEDIPVGNKEANKVIKTVGEKPSFDFEPQNHMKLNEKLDWFDFRIAASISGSNFVFYKNDAVKLIYALTKLMIRNNVKYGFQPVIPPFLVKEQALFNSGNLPKFAGDYYQTDEDKLCLLPTAEVSLTNVHANHIFEIEQLPVRYTAWTSCFRREAGSHGAHDRGLIRIHQFEKVEIYTICEQAKSDKELEYMLSCAENLLQQLGLHYQVTLLATQDCSFSSARTYDIEVWLPGQKQFSEISSISNCTDFQSRRAGIRYRSVEGKKTNFVHTLNASSLALPRLMIALIEQYQQSDGSVRLPVMLQEVMDGLW